MKLFTKEINSKLFKQYSMGSNLEKQVAVAKVFNPYGDGRWFLLNSDPEDPDYIWAIVQMHGEVEMGSISRRELETLKVGRWKLPLERDLGFQPVNAAQLMVGLREGKFYKDGGWVEYAQGGVVKWQDAQIGDNARVIAENKTGLIMQAYGRKFHLRFVDGSEKTYDAKELEFFKDEEEDEFAKGGVLSVGQKFGDWSITQYKPIVFEETGGTRDGLVKLVNQDTLDVILIQYDGALRNAKWFARNKGVRIEGKNPKEVIEKLKLQSFAKGGKVDEIEKIGHNFIIADKEGNQFAIKDWVAQGYIIPYNGSKYWEHFNVPKEKWIKIQDIDWDNFNVRKSDFDVFLNELKNKSDEILKKYHSSFAKGGVTFSDKVSAVKSSLLKRKKVSPKVQKDYGKTYSPKEAEESAKRIVGAMTAKERLKKSLKKVK